MAAAPFRKHRSRSDGAAVERLHLQDVAAIILKSTSSYFVEDAMAPNKPKENVVKVRPRTDRRLNARTLPTETDIARRAHQLFVERGGEHGRDWEDWLRAERELLPPIAQRKSSDLR